MPQSSVPVKTNTLILLAVFLLSFYQSFGQAFGYTGVVQSYTFANNVCIKIKAWGAGGGPGGSDVAGNGGNGGGGGYAEQLFTVNAGDVLQVYTGGGGHFGVGGSCNGSGAGGWGYGSGGRGGNAGCSGGSGAGGGGGGSSTILLNGTVILVAAGGGGGGGSGCANLGANAGGGGQAGQPASGGQDGPVNPCNTPTGAAGYDRGGGDGAGGGGGGGGWNGGAGGGVTSQGGTDCNYGGGAGSGGGGTSLGTTIINGAAQIPGNSADPDLCAACALGSTVPNTLGGNGIVILIISNITLTTTASNNGPLCPGATLNLSGQAAAITYNWSGPQNFTSAVQNPSIPTVTTGNSGVYTLIVTDTIGCADTVTTNAVVNPNPTASISPPVDTLTCSVTNLTLTASSNAPVANYNWGGGNLTSTDNITQPGTYNVTATDAATGCTGSAFVSVGQNLTAPVVSINPPAPLTCGVTTVGLTAVSDSATATYQWSNGSSLNPDSVSLPGSYTVTATAPGNGCTASASTTVTQIPTFIDTFSVLPVSCSGQANGGIQVTVNGPAPPYIFSWSNGANTQNLSNIAAGGYSVTITDQNQCVAIISGIVVPQAAPITILFSSINETCFNGSDASINTNVTGGIPGYTYLWNDGVTTQNRNNLPVGTYTVTATDNAGCTMSASEIITQPAQLLVNAAVSNPYCVTLPPNGSITLSPSLGTSPYQYQWTGGLTTSTITNLLPGNYAVTVTDANDCTADSSFALAYIYDFTVQASPSATITLGDSAELSYIVNGTAGTYAGVWSPGYSLGCTGCNVTPANPVRTTLYQILITDSAGCTASDTVTVYVVPDYRIFIPNVFTPNGDGNNDFFEVFGKKEIWQFFEVQIFDRLGEKVYQSNNVNFKWDGIFKGAILPPAVFVYQVRVVYIDDHTDQLYKGEVTLIR